ncbi:MAG: winged helix-turn-helix domain-containing protein, partial [Burkholderiaceae bacterium]|nr:winged helix-turn-helix domain-containing protein [Burkholderiaceae bacterium]
MPLYLQLASHYRQAIHKGALPPGARMPSVRGLMGLHQVSMSTALQACRWLEAKGLLEARARAGYFVRAHRAAGLPPARFAVFLPLVFLLVAFCWLTMHCDCGRSLPKEPP